MQERQGSKVIVALDYANKADAMAFVARVSPDLCRLKVGKEMFTLFGPQIVRDLQQRGFDVFLDLKFHDIPNTTAHAVAAAAELGVWMVNVHASGGARMMTAAREALLPFGKDAPLLIAVTVLTSMDESDLRDLGVTLSPAEHADSRRLWHHATRACRRLTPDNQPVAAKQRRDGVHLSSLKEAHVQSDTRTGPYLFL